MVVPGVMGYGYMVRTLVGTRGMGPGQSFPWFYRVFRKNSDFRHFPGFSRKTVIFVIFRVFSVVVSVVVSVVSVGPSEATVVSVGPQ